MRNLFLLNYVRIERRIVLQTCSLKRSTVQYIPRHVYLLCSGLRSEDLEDLQSRMVTIVEAHAALCDLAPQNLSAEMEALAEKHEALRTSLERFHLLPETAPSEGHYIPEEDSDSKSQPASVAGAVRKKLRARGRKKLVPAADSSKNTGDEASFQEPLLPVEASPSQAVATVSQGRPKHVGRFPLHAHSVPNLGDDGHVLVTPGGAGRSDRRGFLRQDAGVTLQDSLNWQFSSESYGEFIPESDSDQQISRRESDASDIHLSTDVFGNITAPLANFERLADTIAPMAEDSIKETLAEQIHDIHKKYVNLIETNSALRMQLSEVAIERSVMRNEIELLKDEKECLVQIIGKDRADSLLSTVQDPSTDYLSVNESNKSQVGSDLSHIAPPQMSDLEQTVQKLREQNEILVQENLKLTSQVQPHSPKAAWEPTDSLQSAEFDFDSLKANGSPLSLSEPSSPVSPRTGRKRTLELEKKLRKLKEQNELLVQDNLTLTSNFESQVSKAAWEVKTMKSSYEEEIRELKVSLEKYKDESEKLKDAYTELKIKYECVTDSENREAKMQIISELNRSREAEAKPAEDDLETSPKRQQFERQSSVSSASGDEILLDDENDVASLRARVKDQWKNIKELMKKLRQSEDAVYMVGLQEKNNSLEEENEELQAVIDRATNMKDLQQLRRRDRDLTSENEELRLKLNEAILQPNLEVDTLRERSMMLEEQNRSLFERLDNDVIKAEEDLMELRKKCDTLLQEKEEIEDEFKICRDRLEKDLQNLQHRYEEVVEENDLLHNQINTTKDTAQHSVHQMQVQVEEITKEHDILQRESEEERERSRKEIHDLRNRLESLQKESSDMKRDFDLTEKKFNALKESTGSYSEELKDENTSLKEEVAELIQKSEEDDKQIDKFQHELNEFKSKNTDLQKYCDEVKADLKSKNEDLTVKLNDVQKDNEMMSESMKDLKNDKASLTEELSDLQGWYEQKEREFTDKISRLVEEAKTLKLDLNSTEKLLTETNEKVQVLEASCSDLEQKNRDLELLNEEYKGRVATLVGRLEIVQKEIVASEDEKQSLKAEVKEVMAGIEELADFDAEVWKTKQALQDELSDLKTKFKNLKAKYKDLSEEKEKMNEDNKQVQQEREGTKELLEKSERKNQQLREDIRELMSSIEELADFDAHMWSSKEALIRELKSLQKKYDESQGGREETGASTEKTTVSTPISEALPATVITRPVSESENSSSTRRQLEDIISENETLKVYVESLKLTYETLKQNYEDCVREKEALAQDVKDLMASLEELVAFDAEMWKGKAAAEGELKHMRNRYGDMQKAVLQKQEEIERRKVEREETNREKVVVVKETTAMWDEKVAFLEAEKESLKRELESVTVTLEYLKSDFLNVARERDARKADVNELMESLEELVSFDAEVWKSKTVVSGELEETRRRYQELQESLVIRKQKIEDRLAEQSRDVGGSGKVEANYAVKSSESAAAQLESENKRYKEQLLEMGFEFRSLREEHDQILKEKQALSNDVKELMASMEELVTFDANIWKSKTEMSQEFHVMKQKHDDLQKVLQEKEFEIQRRNSLSRRERLKIQERQQADLAQMKSRRLSAELDGPSIWMDEKGTEIRCVVDEDGAVGGQAEGDSHWQDRYVNMQFKYVDFINTIEEMSEPKSPSKSPRSRGVSEADDGVNTRRSPARRLNFAETDSAPIPSRPPEVALTGEMGCDQCMILLHDNDRLRENLAHLQSDLMATRLDRLEVETSYSERNFYKEQKEHLEEEVRTLIKSFKEEKNLLNETIKELQAANEELQKENADLQHGVEREEEKFRKLLHGQRAEALAQTETADNREELVKQLQLADTEAKDLHEKLRAATQERSLLEIQVEHLKRECRLCERHIKDLEKEVETQYVQLDELTLEHRELIEILAETKLQLEINRQHQSRNVGKMEEAVSRLEETMSVGSGRSTPRAHSVPPSEHASPPRPAAGHSGQSTPARSTSVVVSTADDVLPDAVEHVSGDGSRIPGTEGTAAVGSELTETQTPRQPEESEKRDRLDKELSALKVELAELKEAGGQLKEHKADLLEQVTEQKATIESLREQLSQSAGELTEDSVVKVLKEQLTALEAQNSTLLGKLEAKDGRIGELVKQKVECEERFRRERAHLLERLLEKEQTANELARRVDVLERHIRRQRNLEVMTHHRNLMEVEIQKQKQMFEMELDTIDTIIRERSGILSSERAHIVRRLDHLEGLVRGRGLVLESERVAALDKSVSALGSELGVPSSLQLDVPRAARGLSPASPLGEVFSGSVPVVSEGARPRTLSEPQLDRLSGMKEELERRYRLAIAKLRTNLKSEASKHRKKDQD